MKKYVWILAIFLVSIGCLGFYRGWFVVSGGHENASNKVDVNLTLDPDKVKDDAATVGNTVRDLTVPAKK